MKKVTSFYKNKILIFSFETLFWTFHPLQAEERMKNAVLTFGYTSVYSASSVEFYFVKNDDNYKVVSELAVCEIILSELQIKAFCFF